MSALRLRLKDASRQPVDASALQPARLATLSRAQIAALPLQTGTRRVRLDELFETEGEPGGDAIVFSGPCGALERMGYRMESGFIRVEADAGGYAGLELAGGTMEITGNAGAYAGAGMSAGRLRVAGSVGDYAGAALPGDPHVMGGGVLIVEGDAGARLGDRMRRGMIVVLGDCGPYCGSRMAAGTIAVLGDAGESPGYAMRRGTLLLGRAPAHLPPTFNDCGAHTLGFLGLLYSYWRSLPGRIAEAALPPAKLRRYVGDLGADGRGEILFPQ